MASLLAKQARLLLQPEFANGRKVKKIFQKLLASNYMTRTGIRRFLPVNTVLNFVPQQEVWIVERFGKYNATLLPGLNILVPFIDEIKYVQSLKEIAIEVPQQSAITRDNVTLHLDGVLFFRVIDPYKASYGVEDPQFAITQIALTTMRSELVKISLDDVFKERDALNHIIVEAINSAAQVWGINILRYEIRDIQLPINVKESMHMQAGAERKKRASILESEGQRESAINRATGEANAILVKSKARAQAINMISRAMMKKYGKSYSNLTNNTVILPANIEDAASMLAQAMAVLGQTTKLSPATDPPTDDDPSVSGSSGSAPSKPSKTQEIPEAYTVSGSSLPSGLGPDAFNLLGNKKDRSFLSIADSPTIRRNLDKSDDNL